MTLTQNGWLAIADYGDPLLMKNPTVPGTDVRLLGGVRAGPAGEVLLQFASNFHHQVEQLVQTQGCWGFQPRVIAGSTTLSNHASGTAIDLNSARHPMGRGGTFTLQQRASIRALLETYRGVIRWGGDFTGRPDDMHFEIVGTATDLPHKTEDWYTMATAQDLADALAPIREDAAESRRMLGVLLGWQGPGPGNEAAAMARISATGEDAQEARRMLGVLLGWQPPAPNSPEPGALSALRAT
jgi:hypothetical protein